MPENLEKHKDLSISQLGYSLTNIQGSFAKFAAYIILLNLSFNYLRVQDIIKPLGSVKVPLLLTMVCFLFFVQNIRHNWTKQTKLLAIFIVYLGVYGFVGKVLYDPLVRNDFRSFWTWGDLTMGVFGLSLPIAAIFASRRALSLLAFVLSITGMLLAAYAATHGGKGPAGWVGDENDCCFALLSLFPFCVFFVQHSKSLTTKAFHSSAALCCLGGMVSTMSRGGFLGLVAVLGYLFYRSRQKAKAIIVSAILILVALPFVPQQYWDEMKTIRNVKEGTAAKRTDYWIAATKVWLLPGNILIGVGLSNSPFWLGDVQEASAGTEYGIESFFGRQVHSMYFQLISELGLVGIYFIVAIIGGTFFKNRNFFVHLGSRHDRLSRIPLANKEQGEFAQNLLSELQFCHTMLRAINTSIIGCIASGAFISVLYYPPLWLLVGISAAAQGYTLKISSITEDFESLLLTPTKSEANVILPTNIS